ncbi:Cytochrome c4 [Thalassocella blandensis]|nr:Cytochrome c4 [Thalassocella blandensis]
MNNLFRKTIVALGLIGASASALADGNVENGKAMAEAECSACHSADGNSASPMFPKIAGLGEKYILKQLRDIQNAEEGGDPKKSKRVVNEMAGLLKNKSDQDLQDLAAYFGVQTMQLSGAQEIQVQVNSGEKVDGLKLGAKVYRSGNLENGVPACSGCHSPRGLGNAPASYPRLSGQYPDYIVKQLKAFRSGDRTNDGDTKVMRMVASKLSDAEITAVANFIAGLH